MNYPGGKNGAGTWQQIINQQPPHRRYIEPFLGSGAVLRRKRPAELNIGVDLDARCRDSFANDDIVAMYGLDQPEQPGRPKLLLLTMDAFAFLRDRFEVREHDTLVYLDPPYLVGKDGLQRRRNYRHEIQTIEEHAALLDLIVALPCMVQISGYWSELYADRLRAWRAIQFTGQTRGGPATEWLWMNYPEPTALHDYRFFGADRRKRLDFKRMVTRWQKRLEQMPAIQRHAMTEALRIQAAEMPSVHGSVVQMKAGHHQAAEMPSGSGNTIHDRCQREGCWKGQIDEHCEALRALRRPPAANTPSVPGDDDPLQLSPEALHSRAIARWQRRESA